MPSASEFLGFTPAAIDPIAVSEAGEAPEALRTRKEQLQERLPDVDIESGGPADVRADLSFVSGEDVNRLLDDSFGPGGHRQTEDGTVVRIKDPDGEKEVLLDEFGMSLKDFSDLKGALPEIGGALAAGVALAATGTVSLPVIAAVTAVSGQGAGAISDLLTAIGPINLEKVKEIATTRGQNAAIDFILDLTGTKAVQMMSKRPRAIDTEDVITPETVEASAARLSERTGTDVPLSAAEVTGNPTLARVESIGEKLPFASETFAGQAARQESALRDVQRSLGGVDESVAGRAATNELNIAADLSRQEATEQTARAGARVERELERVGDLLGPGGRNLDAGTGGASTRGRVVEERNAFREEARRNYADARASEGGEEAIVSPDRLRNLSRELFEEVPQERYTAQVLDEATGEVTEEVRNRPALAFMPPQVRRVISSLSRLDDMTIDQARRARTIVNNAIIDGEAIPGMTTRDLRRISSEITGSIDDAADEVGGELAENLRIANTHYRENIDQFLDQDIAPLFREFTKKGFVEDEEIVRGLLSSNNVGRLQRLRGVVGEESFEVLRRTMWNEVLDQSQNLLVKGGVDAKRLSGVLSKMSPAFRNELFGDQANDVVRVTRLLAAKNQVIPLDQISDIRGGIPQALRAAAQTERKTAAEFDSKLIKPFLKGEINDINPDNFIRHTMTNGTTQQINAVMKKLSPETQDKVKKGIIESILEKSTRQATPDDVIAGFLGEGDQIIGGSTMFDNMRSAFGPDTSKKIASVLGKETMQDLKDLAVVASARERKSGVGAAGGLIAGFVVSSLMRGRLTSLPMLAQYKVLSWVLTNKQVIKALKSRKIPLTFESTLTPKSAAGTATAINVLTDLKRELGDDTMFAQALDALGIDPPEQFNMSGPSASDFLSEQTGTE